MIEPRIRRRIDNRLEEIERSESVRILLAVESGSRAWGFPSPDSDYDVRFLYARPRDWYLSIDLRRDVIECPIEDALDINGWDIRKALHLLLKANPVLAEWLTSPIRYREDAAVVTALRDLALRAGSRRPARHHYLRLGQSQYEKELAGRDTVRLKRYFYALRPALALRWLRTRPDAPPMDLPSLRAGLELESELDRGIEDLTARKARQSEMGTGPRIGMLDRFLEAEFAVAADIAAGPDRESPAPAPLDAANELFRTIVADERRTRRPDGNPLPAGI